MPNDRVVPRFDRTLEPYVPNLRFMQQISISTDPRILTLVPIVPETRVRPILPDGGVVGSIPVLKVMVPAPIVRVLYRRRNLQIFG